MKNHWLAGFSDADASFQIKILNRVTKKMPSSGFEDKEGHAKPNLRNEKGVIRSEVRLNYQVDQKTNNILLLIKQFFGGNIGHRKSQNTYYYGSTSFGSAKKVIKYFDNFHLQSSKHNNYLKWRKAYIMVQAKDHLTEKGIDKIYKLKNSMNRNSE